MEPTSSFNWNLDVAEFVPSGPPVQTGGMKKPKKKEEEKKTVMPKETVTVALFGPIASGKSFLACSLAGNAKFVSIDHGRLVNKDFKTRRYVMFDSNDSLHDQLVLASISDYVVIVLKIDAINEDELRALAVLLKGIVTSRVVVVLTHMDLINWSDSIYFATLNSVRRVLDSAGLNDNIFVPVGRDQNVGQKMQKEVAPWYNGKSFILTLESLRAKTFKVEKGVKAPGFPVLDQPSTFILRLISGALGPASKLIVMPSGDKVDIQALHDSCGNRVDNAKAGDVVKIQVRGAEGRGLVFCENHEKCVTAKEFRAEAVFMNLEDGRVEPGYPCRIQIHNTIEDAEISEVISVYDLETKAKQKIHFARNGQKANLIIKLQTALCAENSSKGWDILSKFYLWKDSKIIAAGKVVELFNRIEEIASQMGLF